jgi:hypothetical protein
MTQNNPSNQRRYFGQMALGSLNPAKLACIFGIIVPSLAVAQLPSGLPWPGSTVGGRQVMLQPGVAAGTCGTLAATSIVPEAERWTFGLMNVEGVMPASGRQNVTASTEMYHHPSWHVDQIGNVYGITINTSTGDIFAAASSNYGAGFWGQ